MTAPLSKLEPLKRLPPVLRDAPPHDRVWRLVDGEWRRGPLAGA